MDRLIAYAARSDSSFPARIKGATAADIAAYQEILGAPIPALLREYFAAMGERAHRDATAPDWLGAAPTMVKPSD